MSSILDTLIEMGFSKERAELAISKTGSQDVQTVMDWLLTNEDMDISSSTDLIDTPEKSDNNTNEKNLNQTNNSEQEQQQTSSSTQEQEAKSIKCDDCGKLFDRQEDVEFHASKTGHENFSESIEEKKPLSEDEKREQLAKIEAKLKQRRLEREAREKQEALEKEKNRIKSGKEMLEAKKKHDEIEMKKIIEQRKREKEEERLARQRVKEQIEQDKLARKIKFGGGMADEEIIKTSPVQQQTNFVNQPITTTTTNNSYSEVHLQIRLTNGSALMQTFSAKEPLSAVRLYVEKNRKDGEGPFSLMTNFPKRVFGPDDYDAPLEALGLGPRATLIVSKS